MKLRLSSCECPLLSGLQAKVFAQPCKLKCLGIKQSNETFGLIYLGIFFSVHMPPDKLLQSFLESSVKHCTPY